MKMYDLIFSKKRSQRIKRHFLFWLAVFLYHIVRISMIYPTGKIWELRWSLLEMTAFWGVFTNILFSYTVVYWLVPNYLKKRKNFFFTVWLLVMIIILHLINVLHNGILNQQFNTAAGLGTVFLQRGPIIRLLGNPPLICGLLLSLKTLKTWHQKQTENEILTREKANAELQLLKAQIHPHFLFNTLNNIYSFTLTKSPLAAELVQKLSDMLNYMIKDCESIMVPLEKEIQILKDYIGLEKIRYGTRLDIQMHINGECKSKMIAPLLMIPFVENCFKHGASMMRGKQWMHLIININETDLDLNLSNSKPSQPNTTRNKIGIGLLNVKKRLGLLYPGKHQLNINSTDNTFSVYLKIALQNRIANSEIKVRMEKLPAYNKKFLQKELTTIATNENV